MNYAKFNKLLENLNIFGSKKQSKGNNFLSTNLLIKHKASGVKYTISKVGLDKQNKQPAVIAYRYFGKRKNKKLFILITHKNFKNYEPV